MSNTLAFKCYLKSSDGQNSEIRRFTVESDVVGNFTYVKEKVRSIYPQLLREDFKLKYIDEENDLITISSDDELVAALMYAQRKENEPFRLIIELAGAKASQPASGQSTGAGCSNGNSQGDLHAGVTCDGCQGSVRGFRYKCIQCPDYDLCGKCETSGLHPGHTLVRMTGPAPICFPALRSMLLGNSEIPHWRRKHHGRFGHWNHPGRWNAWCPSGVNVDVVDPHVDPRSNESEKPKACKAEGSSSCPFKKNMEDARQAAEAFQANGPEFLQGLGSVLASFLGQFGIDTQVDVHGPETGGACPREAQKKQEEKQEKTKETADDSARSEEKPKEVFIPIQVEKPTGEEKKDVPAAPKEVEIPITVVKDEKKEDPAAAAEKPATDPHPYFSLSEAVAAAHVAALAAEACNAAAAAKAAEAAQHAQQAAARSSPENSPTRESEDWTMVDHVGKQEPSGAAGSELGARPKSPPKQPTPAETPLHPDPVVAGALEKMLAMGFTNEGGWLAQLLEVKEGDIGKALDVLHSRFQQRQQ